MSGDRDAVTRPEQAARQLADIAGVVPPGTRLGTKPQLRQRCGVSVGTFNEALRLAQARGVVDLRRGPGGGIFSVEQPPLVRLGNSVLTLDGGEDAVADAIRIRDHLDVLVIEDAARHSSAADLDGYRAQLEAMARAERNSDTVAFMTANWRLHELFTQVNPSAMLRTIYTALLEIIRSHTVGVGGVDGYPDVELMRRRREVHAELVGAIADQDPDRLRAAIAAHSVRHSGVDHTGRTEPASR
ncbi:FadR/GntR family transcriptional regulator [Amycolatopsis endophytica]|uniref:DNA-binding FadR family transcriptional regulator n=1 Tax=Amycolatopsis endophytica TaxID=860233 RepID=A0A853B1I1_9PSEU|nr:FCD domain-containing protein [Amycolatopsis endophytica]NYI88819.1 DNA-binding FadR family transcriptional regulator [Amycolatopsis endophytica]